MYEYLGRFELNVWSLHNCNVFKTVVVDAIHEDNLGFLF